MEGPSTSLFQGGENIKVCNTAEEREEEVDDQEDQKRRNEEIKNLLTNAFDDLDNDDDSSINSTEVDDSCTQQSSNLFNHINYTDPRNQNFMNSDIQSHGPYVANNYRHEDSINESIYGNEIKTNEFRPLTNQVNETESSLSRNVPLSEYDFHENNNRFNYLCNFETPSNHYTHNKAIIRQNFLKNNYSPVENSGHSDTFDKEKLQHSMIEENHIGIVNSYEHLNSNRNQSCDTSNYETKDQLDVLNIVRLREIEKLTTELRQLQTEKEDSVKQLERKLILTQVEVERANISKNEAQNALLSTKSEISDLMTQISILKGTNKELELSKKNISEELTATKNLVCELEQKITALEDFNSVSKNEKVSEQYFQQLQEKCRMQLQNMQKQIENISQELSDKNVAYNLLEQKYLELSRLNESLKGKNADTINQLAQALEKSHGECERLKTNVNIEENEELRSKLKLALQENDILHRKNQQLEQELELTNRSIKSNYKRTKHNKSENNESPDDFSQKIQQELDRCIVAEGIKRKEINWLENVVSHKEKELGHAKSTIHSLHHELTYYMKLVELFKHEHTKMLKTHSAQEFNKTEKLLLQLDNVFRKCDELEKQKSVIKSRLPSILSNTKDTKNSEDEGVLLNNNIHENNQYVSSEMFQRTIEDIKNESSKKIIELSVELQETLKELDYVKKLYIDVCATKDRLIVDHKNQLKCIRDKFKQCEFKQELDVFRDEVKKHFVTNNELYDNCKTQLQNVIDLQNKLSKKILNKETLRSTIEVKKVKVTSSKEVQVTHPDSTLDGLTKDNYPVREVFKTSEISDSTKEDELNSNKDEEIILELRNQLNEYRASLAEMKNTESSYKNELKSILAERDNLKKEYLQLKIQMEKTAKLELTHRKKIKELELELKSFRSAQSELKNNQAEKNQKQYSPEFNPAYHGLRESEIRQIRENTVKTMREQMEQKVAEELKHIENYYEQKRKADHEKFEKIMLVLKHQLKEKDFECKLYKELSSAEESKSNNILKLQEKAIEKSIETKVASFEKEINLKNQQIAALQNKIQQTRIELEEDRTLMAEVMSEWVAEIKIVRVKNVELENEISALKKVKDTYLAEIESLKTKTLEDLNLLRQKYESAKKVASNYKEYAKKKEEYVMNECKRVENGYKKALEQMKQKVESLLSSQGKEVAQQLNSIQNQYDDRLQKLQLLSKFKKK